MNKNLPKLFKNTTTIIDGHNKSVFYSFKDESEDSSRNIDSGGFVEPVSFSDYFNVLVEIKTKDEVYVTKIIGKVNDHILTSDKRTIYIKDILGIRIKNSN